VYILIGEVVENNLKRSARTRTTDPGKYPLGTAFAFRTRSMTHLLSAYHTMTSHCDCTKWYISHSVGRDTINNKWIFNDLLEVEINSYDQENDVVVLTVENPFNEEDTVLICPKEKIPTTADDEKFKTYYCPVETVSDLATWAPLSIVASDSVKMISVKNTENGRMVLNGGLCGGSSGGAVVDKNGYAIGMHIASLSSGLSVKDIHEKDEKEKRKRRKDGDAISESSESFANCHGSYQEVLILSQNSLVNRFL
jgi:hypothetical protein